MKNITELIKSGAIDLFMVVIYFSVLCLTIAAAVNLSYWYWFLTAMVSAAFIIKGFLVWRTDRNE